jgi:hypothetical protein
MVTQVQRKRQAKPKHGQYFAQPKLVTKYITPFIKGQTWYSDLTCIAEVAVGNGDLIVDFPQSVKADLYPQPQCKGIIRQDFLTSTPASYGITDPDTTLILTGPPYNGGLSIRFLNKVAALGVKYTAMLLPLNFKGKWSYWKAIEKRLDLYAELDLPSGFFYLPSDKSRTPYDVPSIFQIWVLDYDPDLLPEISKKIERDTEPECADFCFLPVSRANEADFAIRSSGRPTAREVYGVKEALQSGLKKYHYVKVKQNFERVLSFFTCKELRRVAKMAVCSFNLSRQDCVRVYQQLYGDK